MKLKWGSAVALFSVCFLFAFSFAFAQQTTEVQPSLSQALTAGSTVPLPQPVVDFLQTLDQIHVDQNLPILNDIKSLTQDAVGQGLNLNSVSSPNDLWSQLNSWFVQHTGISMSKIVQAAGNVGIWFLNALISLIKTGLQHLPGQ